MGDGDVGRSGSGGLSLGGMEKGCMRGVGFEMELAV